MNKVIEDIFFLKAVTSLGDVVTTTFTVAPLFYNAQRQQIMELVSKNYRKSWIGVVLYIGASDFGRCAL